MTKGSCLCEGRESLTAGAVLVNMLLQYAFKNNCLIYFLRITPLFTNCAFIIPQGPAKPGI